MGLAGPPGPQGRLKNEGPRRQEAGRGTDSPPSVSSRSRTSPSGMASVLSTPCIPHPRDGQRALDGDPRSRGQRQALGLEIPGWRTAIPGVWRGCGVGGPDLGRRGAHRHLGWRAAQQREGRGSSSLQSGAAPNLARTTPSTPQLWFPHGRRPPRQGALGASVLSWEVGGLLVTGSGQGPDFKCPAVMGQLDEL